MAKKKSSISNFDNPVFSDKDAARTHLESIRWPAGPVCPHCGCYERVMTLKGKSTRPGVYKCGDCRKQFTVTVGTVFEDSHIPLNKWVYATHLLCSSKKGISAHQLHRMIGVTYKSAWFMMHRLREAMREPFEHKLGGDGHYVEADETYIGKKTYRLGEKGSTGGKGKERVMALVERDGQVRSFHVKRISADTLAPIILEQVAQDSALITDEAGHYKSIGTEYAGHGTVNHSIREYVRGSIHTNTIEGFFSILKRGIFGIYQHCSAKHLKRYLAEYDFRYTFRQKQGYNDEERTVQALRSIEGKRLAYNPTHSAKGLALQAGL